MTRESVNANQLRRGETLQSCEIATPVYKIVRKVRVLNYCRLGRCAAQFPAQFLPATSRVCHGNKLKIVNQHMSNGNKPFAF